jgi:uncharacterized RDD family membrane protein YckC
MHIFNRVKFLTPESVELEFTLAGIGNRVWALVIDYHVLGLTIGLFFIAWTTITVQLRDFWANLFGDKAGLWSLAIAFFIFFVIYVGYFVFFEAIWQGQTPGKRVAKIRVVRDDGRPVGLQQTTLRALLRPFDEVLFIGAFLIIFSGKEKRLGDLVAGTIVIQTQAVNVAAKEKLVLSEAANSVCDNLLQVADLSPMLPDDFAVIREYLIRRNIMSEKARASLSLELTRQVQAIIKLENLSNNISPDVFLEAIYLAYQRGGSREWGVGE